jgi:hypothetical protein
LLPATTGGKAGEKLMMKLAAIGMMFMLLGLPVHGQTSLSGDLSKFTLDSANSPYIIEKDIEVPAGKKVVVNDGCVFLFKPFTGLAVFGSLIVKGTQARPVVFTTINDSLFNKQSRQTANPFDWNGITIDKDAAEVALSEFRLMYSVFGIKSQRRDVVVKNGRFISNGQFHFTIFDKIQYVQDNTPFSYPDDSAAVEITPQKAFKTAVSISSFPLGAEIYINKKPGRKISPDARTPITISGVQGPSVWMTLFKKGYSDTTFALVLAPFQTKFVDINLAPLRAEGIDAQNRLLHDRVQARLGKYYLVASPLFLAAGAGCLYFAEKNFQSAEAALLKYNQSLRTADDPEKKALDKVRQDETDKGNLKRYAAIGAFGFGGLALTAGIILYF